MAEIDHEKTNCEAIYAQRWKRWMRNHAGAVRLWERERALTLRSRKHQSSMRR